MSRPNEDQARVQRLEILGRMARTWAGEERAEETPAWAALDRRRRLAARRPARIRLAAGTLVLATGIVAAVFWGRTTSRGLTYTLTGLPVDDGAAEIRPVAQPARLSFSDGSDVVMRPGARGRVVATTVRGARVRLEGGEAHFAITHRPGTEWSVVAGPYTVVVHGTVFDVAWRAERGALEVGLIAGEVSVRGPVAGGEVIIRPGQRLTAEASSGQMRIGALRNEEPKGVPSAISIEKTAGLGPETVSGSEPSESPSVSPAPVRAAPAITRTRAVGDVTANWGGRVASGAFAGVVSEAESLGVERCLAQAPASALMALADAARYSRRTELARRALLAERRRYPGSAGTEDAAFLLGRLADDVEGDLREAVRWYDQYLAETTHDTYAAEAHGRRMVALDRLGRSVEAQADAATYLQRFPDGVHAARANRLLGR